jgi:hypothetical protein
MWIDRDNLRALLLALGIIGAALLLRTLLTANPAQAQRAVSDASVAAVTAAMDQVQEPGFAAGPPARTGRARGAGLTASTNGYKADSRPSGNKGE